MGVCVAMAPCGACGEVFQFHPNKVPSFRLRGEEREPICKACMDKVNAKRREMGLPPHPILDGAYDPAEEGEVAWE